VTDPKTELEELRALRQEGAEKRARRKRTRAARKPSPEPPAAAEEERGAAEPGTEEPAAEAQAPEEQAPEWMETLEDLATHLDSAVTDIEEATREHPALALLAAFTIGVFLGRLFSRR